MDEFKVPTEEDEEVVEKETEEDRGRAAHCQNFWGSEAVTGQAGPTYYLRGSEPGIGQQDLPPTSGAVTYAWVKQYLRTISGAVDQALAKQDLPTPSWAVGQAQAK